MPDCIATRCCGKLVGFEAFLTCGTTDLVDSISMDLARDIQCSDGVFIAVLGEDVVALLKLPGEVQFRVFVGDVESGAQLPDVGPNQTPRASFFVSFIHTAA
jgi:hypothetical protein